MTTTLQKWGNSQAIRIPKKVLTLLDLKECDTLDLVIGDGNFTLKKTTKERPKTLAQLYENFYGKSIDEIIDDAQQNRREKEFVDWGDPVGDEVW